MPVNLSSFELRELVSEVLAEVEQLVNQSKITVTSDFGRRMPTLRSDRSKVKQVLMNLLSNALKFTPLGSVTIASEYLLSTKQVRIAVADTGIGIAKKDQA